MSFNNGDTVIYIGGKEENPLMSYPKINIEHVEVVGSTTDPYGVVFYDLGGYEFAPNGVDQHYHPSILRKVERNTNYESSKASKELVKKLTKPNKHEQLERLKQPLEVESN